MLEYMIKNPRRVLSRDELLNQVWGYRSYPCTRTVDTHILKLLGKETSGTVSEGVPSDGRRATEDLRQHRGPIARAGRASSPAIQVARSTGPDRGVRWIAAASLTRVNASQRGQPAQARAGRQSGGDGFFQGCLAKSRGSTPAERKLWRERHLRPNPGDDVDARQPECRADVSVWAADIIYIRLRGEFVYHPGLPPIRY